MPRPTLGELAAAGACSAWAAGFLAGEQPRALVLAPLVFLAVLPSRRHPAAAAVGVAVVGLLIAAAGVSAENPASVAAGLTVAYACGRHAGTGAGLAGVAVLAAALSGVAFAVPDFVFIATVCGATWAAGRLVRRRTDAARRAAAEASDLAARNPDAQAAQVVAEERGRLAGDALAVIRRAVGAMHRRALSAERELDRDALVAIQEDGTRAVTELRRLLGLLRSELPDDSASATGEPHARRPWPTDAMVGLGLVALVVAEAALRPQGASTLSAALTALLVATVAVRRVDPALACVAALLPVVVSVALDAPLVYELAFAITYVLLAWSAAVEGRLRTYAALAVLAAVTLVVTHQDAPGNEGMLVGLVTLAAAAGRAWGVRDRQGRASAATASELRAAQEAATERAVRAERLRLARELHDVASHAVGVMVLQAGAALALRERDPDAARSAVRSIQTAGVEAMSELHVLFGILDAGAIGTPGIATAVAGQDIAEALTELVARMRSGGLDVSFDYAGPVVEDSAVASTAFRIVQEALTNAARYAPRSHVEVSIHGYENGVAVAVSDDGPGSAAHDAGFGLVGLSERVRALGGELAAGPEPAGGFAVRARLPVAIGSGRGA